MDNPRTRKIIRDTIAEIQANPRGYSADIETDGMLAALRVRGYRIIPADALDRLRGSVASLEEKAFCEFDDGWNAAVRSVLDVMDRILAKELTGDTPTTEMEAEKDNG